MSLNSYFIVFFLILAGQISGQDRTRIFEKEFPASGFLLSLDRLPDGELPGGRGPRYVYEFMLQRGDGPELPLARLNSGNPYFTLANEYRLMSIVDMKQDPDGKTGVLVYGSGIQEYFHLLFNARDGNPAAKVSRFDILNNAMKDSNAICTLETPERLVAKSSDGKQTHYLERLASGTWTFDGNPMNTSFGFTKEGLPDWPENVIRLYQESESAAARKSNRPASSYSEGGLPGASVSSSTAAANTKPQQPKTTASASMQDEQETGIGSIIGLCLAGAVLAWVLMRLFGKQSS